jgi:hypothetical protein
MDDSQYIQQRTNDILRERIRLGMYGGADGGARKKKKVVRKRRVGRPCGTGDFNDEMMYATGSGYRRRRKAPVRRRRRGAGCDEMMHALPYHEEPLIRYSPEITTLGSGVRIGGRRRMTHRRRAGAEDSGLMDMFGRGYGTHEGAVKGWKTRRSGSKSSKRTGTHKTSKWIKFVKGFAKTNKISYKQALEEAGPYYRKQYG